MRACNEPRVARNSDTEFAYNRYVIGRITIDNLYLAQAEKDQVLTQFVQGLRGYWRAYYGLRRDTLFDFETGRALRPGVGAQ